jgi:hypothetical protein
LEVAAVSVSRAAAAGVLVGVMLGIALGGIAVRPAQAQAPACEGRQAAALERIAEQSRRQAAALERIAERLR